MCSLVVAIHYAVDDRDMYPEAIALRDSGFRLAEIAEHVLKTYVRFQFADTLDDSAAAHTIFMRRPTPVLR